MLGVTFLSKAETGMSLSLQSSTATAKVLPNRKTMRVTNGHFAFLTTMLLRGLKKLKQDLSCSPGWSHIYKMIPNF